ncbi:MAG: hypothetical protein WCS88_04825 [Patescibacteria group bacterium]|jgi:hypothetical protein
MISINNPLGEEVLQNSKQLRCLNMGTYIAGVAMVVWFFMALIIADNLDTGKKLPISWYIIEAITLMIFVGFIIMITPRVRNKWPYEVPEGNTNIYFLNSNAQVGLARPGLYWGSRKCQLFKIEPIMNRRAEFIISGGYLCYVNYQVKFCYQPPPEQVELFLTWLNELDSLATEGQKAVMERLQKDCREDKYPFKLFTQNEMGIAF